MGSAPTVPQFSCHRHSPQFAVPSLCPWCHLCWQQSHLQRVASFFFGNFTRKTRPCVQKILHRFWWQFQFRRVGFFYQFNCRRVGLSASWFVGELSIKRFVPPSYLLKWTAKFGMTCNEHQRVAKKFYAWRTLYHCRWVPMSLSRICPLTSD